MERRGFRHGRQCSICSSEICDNSKTGKCRKCCMAAMNNDPAIRERAVTGIRRTMADPKVRANMKIAAKICARRRMADPAMRAMYAKLMREKVQPLTCTPEAVANRDFAKRGRAISAAKMAWCPEGYRDFYLKLMRNHGVKQAEARRMVIEQHKKDLANLSPFERQMRALEKGATLIANDRGPMFGEALKTA